MKKGGEIKKALGFLVIFLGLIGCYWWRNADGDVVESKVSRKEAGTYEYRVRLGEDAYDIQLRVKEQGEESALINDSETQSDRKQELERYLRKEEMKSRDQEYFELPQEFQGEPITYEEKRDYTPVILLILGVLAVVLVFISPRKEEEKRLEKRRDALLMEYSQLVEILTILMGCGMSLRNVWGNLREECGRGGPLSEELEGVWKRMQAGGSLAMALTEFADACNLHTYRKFVGLLIQNQEKGTQDLQQLLELEVQEAEAMRLQLIKEKAQRAESKLLLPMTALLFIVIIILMAPAIIQMKI